MLTNTSRHYKLSSLFDPHFLGIDLKDNRYSHSLNHLLDTDPMDSQRRLWQYRLSNIHLHNSSKPLSR